MKSFLVDSHLLIWLLFEPERINVQTRKNLSEAGNVYVSLVSIWELAIKHNKNKLAYTPEELLAGVDVLGAKMLGVEANHILALADVKTCLKDPFDKMLIAQAKTENLLLLTSDGEILKIGLDYAVSAKK